MEWYLRSDFWELTFPFMFPPSRIEKAEKDAVSLVSLSARDSGNVLDLCCGPGRFAIPLARMGFEVTGVDSTEFLLDIAGNRASLEDLSIEWVRADMRDYLRESSFDLVISMFTSFGYFSHRGDNMTVLRNARESLRPGGSMIMETMGKEVLASVFSPVTCEETEDGRMLIQRHSISDDWTMIENDWILLQDRTLLGRWKFSHWIYSGEELRGMLLEAGFAGVQLYGDLRGSPYGSDASRLVAVASARKED